MFPARYFPPRYFPPRYFPGSGGAPPPAHTGQIRILIDGADRTGYVYYGQQSNWSTVRGARGACTLSFIIFPGDEFAPQVGQFIEIFDPVTVRVWAGTCEGVEIKWIGDDGYHIIIVTGVTLERYFDTVTLEAVKYSQAAGTPFLAGDCISDLYTRSAVTKVTLGTISSGPAIQALSVTNVATGFTDLATLAGFVWYIDPGDLTLNFHAPAARAAALSLGAAGDIQFETIDWKQQRTDIRDQQVIQLPGLALTALTASFPGDGTTTAFLLPTTPEYIISITILPAGLGGASISWTPGTQTVRVSPAPTVGETVVVKYMDAGDVVATVPSAVPETRSARYRTTRTFTPAGGIQEAEALLAQYATLPSELQFDTEIPGVAIAGALTLAVDFPPEAGALLNGTWLVMEVDGRIDTSTAGLDQLDEPHGHWRYTLHLVNVEATAVFQGDGTSTVFLLPLVPSAVSSITITSLGPGVTVDNSLYSKIWTPATDIITITPALPPGSAVSANYTGPVAPTVQPWQDGWAQITSLPNNGQTPQLPTGAADVAPLQFFAKSLLLFDLTVGDDICNHQIVHHAGIAMRLLGELRKSITADLTVRVNKRIGDLSQPQIELITVTIPSTAFVGDVFEWSLASGSPPTLPPFLDKDTLRADILESDSSFDANGIATFVVEWTFQP